MAMGKAALHVRDEAQLLAILLWRDCWVAETEVKAQDGPVWDSIDRTMLELRASLRELMTEKDQGECDAIMASRPSW